MLNLINGVNLINGDCLEELDKLEENSIDSIVTDPPYELNFMNKNWDNTGIAFKKDTWKKCLRVLKPRRIFISIWRKSYFSQDSLCNRRCRI